MIIRVKKGQDPYARIDKVPINDKRLTWKARGVLLYLLSKPDDWRVIIEDLINQSPQGESAVRSAVHELQDAGYIRREVTRENGKITGGSYTVHERPINTPFGENLNLEKPDLEKPDLENQGRLIIEKALSKEKEESKEVQREKTALRSSNKRSLKGLTRNEVVSIYRSNPEAPPQGLTRPQMLAAVLDHMQGFSQIVNISKWPTIMMRLGQLFNGHRKVELDYQDLLAVAIDMESMPRPRGKPPSLDYLIAVLTREAGQRRAERCEREAQDYKRGSGLENILSDVVKHMQSPPLSRIPQRDS